MNYVVSVSHENDEDMATMLNHAGGSLWNRKNCRLREGGKNDFNKRVYVFNVMSVYKQIQIGADRRPRLSMSSQ